MKESALIPDWALTAIAEDYNSRLRETEEILSSKLSRKYADLELTPELIRKWVLSLSDYYCDIDRISDEIYDYLWTVDKLYQHGGKIYRVVWVRDVSDVDKNNLGSFWTGDVSNIDYYAHGLLIASTIDKKKNKLALISAETPARNISIINVDFAGNPNEKEIQIIDDKKLTNVKVSEYRK